MSSDLGPPRPAPSRSALFVETDEVTHWAVRRAAVEQRTTVRRLVGSIVRDWLIANRYLPERGAFSAEPSDPMTHE